MHYVVQFTDAGRRFEISLATLEAARQMAIALRSAMAHEVEVAVKDITGMTRACS